VGLHFALIQNKAKDQGGEAYSAHAAPFCCGLQWDALPKTLSAKLSFIQNLLLTLWALINNDV